jgi:hypothetical protein
MDQPADSAPDARAGDGSAAIPHAAPGRARMRSKSGLDTAIRQHRRAALVVNTRSRRGSRLYPAIAAGDRYCTLDTHQLNIANGSFHAGRPITGDASADDRLLLVYRLGGPAARRWPAQRPATRSSGPAAA